MEVLSQLNNTEFEIIPVPEDWFVGNNIIYTMRSMRKLWNLDDLMSLLKADSRLDIKKLKTEVNNKITLNRKWTKKFEKLLSLIEKYERKPQNEKLLIEIIQEANCLDIFIKDKDTVDVFVAQLGAEAKKKCMSLMMRLRESGVHAIGALGKGSMKEQLALAEKFNASWTVLIGQIEVIEGIAIIRNMAAGSQEIVQYDDLVEEIIQRLGEEKLDKYSVGVEETVLKGDEEIVGEEYEEMVGTE